MERFEFKSPISDVPKKFTARLLEIELSGKTHLEALEMVANEMEKESNKSIDNQPYAFSVNFTRNEIKFYFEQVEWFNRHGYPARINQEDFNFDETVERAKRYTNPLKQIEYLEQVLIEYRAFAANAMGNKAFGGKVEAEIKALKMESVFAKKPDSKKLVWYGKPSEFGHLFFELQSKGWIGLQQEGEINYSEFARVCMELFEFRPETTEGNLAKELNPNIGKNTLSPDSKGRFKIPFESEMNPKRAKKKK